MYTWVHNVMYAINHSNYYFISLVFCNASNVHGITNSKNITFLE